MQRRETPTARPALASSPCYLNPACLKDAWSCVCESAERIGGGKRAGITQGGISLCRSFSAHRRWLRQAGGPATRGGTSGSASTVPHGKGHLLLVVVQLLSTAQKRDHRHHDGDHDGREHH